MIEVKNQFVRHGLFWIWVLPFAIFLLVPAFVSREEMQIPPAEIALMQELGQDVQKINERADRVFTAVFSDAARFSKKLLTSSVSLDDPSSIRRTAAATVKYHDNLWHMVYRAVWRLAGLWPTFLALALAVAMPALVDGLVVRAKKIDVFESHNPVFFWGAGHSLVMVVGVFVLLPLLPYTISMPVLYGTVGAIALALWVTAANLQTGS
ncbi:MAG: DUF4400 domain-containing protein [Giesbergeria sp.]|uniref:DUF4400 domain-containing protein n=1 Tax=Giesbergeria sp. TaxID=2818473 RepID=UPI002620F8B8|nr:DUF4400 domain-containing protein [Giesbergeria sp.]MDD2609387.1 DUF4400 domain-containing protein [Giesbergeria sp.]